MSDTEQTQRNAEARRWKFEGTVNLGHILTASVMLVGGIGVWIQSHDIAIRHDSRLVLVETTMAELKSNLTKISESQQLAIRTQDKLAATLEAISRKP